MREVEPDNANSGPENDVTIRDSIFLPLRVLTESADAAVFPVSNGCNLRHYSYFCEWGGITKRLTNEREGNTDRQKNTQRI